jgi:hypothetical protein
MSKEGAEMAEIAEKTAHTLSESAAREYASGVIARSLCDMQGVFV